MKEKENKGFKRPTQFAIIVALAKGITPKKIIENGYPKTTVYKYNKKVKDATEEMKKKGMI